MRDVLTFILAGGKGERLNPLTRDRAKPAVPFGGIYRIIDFTLSNCVNSGLRRIYILIQYKSFSLQKHVLAGWGEIVSSQLGEFIDVIPAQQRISSDWYRGTADAIYQNLYAIRDHNPEHILVLAGDHVYKMDYQRMLDFHHDQEADMTVACIPMPKAMAEGFGVIEVNDQNRVCGFQEKPRKPKTIPGQPKFIYASMGIYLFNTNVLFEELGMDAKSKTEHDFGKNIIPQMLKNKKRISVYNFVDQDNRPCYWRDIGTRDAYYQANMDLTKPEPEFNLYDQDWPVRTYHEQFPPIKLIGTNEGRKLIKGEIVSSLVGGGCIIKGSSIIGSVLSPRVKVAKHVQILNSVLMEEVTVGEHVRIRNAIIDKEAVIEPFSEIGYNPKVDKKRFEVTSSGIVIVPKRTVVRTTRKEKGKS